MLLSTWQGRVMSPRTHLGSSSHSLDTFKFIRCIWSDVFLCFIFDRRDICGECNIKTIWNVFRECARAKVKRLVFASSNHTQGAVNMPDVKQTELWRDNYKRKSMKLTDDPFPDSVYGATKIFGEAMVNIHPF